MVENRLQLTEEWNVREVSRESPKLIALAKSLGFEEAVNVTAGLPIIRTSVDHGTAFDLVGRNKANPRNMKLAILLAGRLARSQPAV